MSYVRTQPSPENVRSRSPGAAAVGTASTSAASTRSPTRRTSATYPHAPWVMRRRPPAHEGAPSLVALVRENLQLGCANARPVHVEAGQGGLVAVGRVGR